MKFTIIGGGTAGWIAAYQLKIKLPASDVTVIESSDIPIIGVGEGVTGKLTDMLVDPQMELDEFEFIQKTWALPKYGIMFSGWSKDTSKGFYSPIDGSVTESMPLDLFFYNSILNDDDIALASISGFYSKHYKVPWFIKEGSLHMIGGRAYHIDAYKVGEYFKEKCLLKGVTHINAKVENVDISHNDHIKTLFLENGDQIDGDIFFDCTGFSKVLISKLTEKWIDRKEYLPVDRGLIFKPKDYQDFRKPYTTANAMNNGWVFEIPTRQKIGRGYIYSSSFCDQKSAVSELQSIYGEVEMVQEIQFSSGVYDSMWVGNCIALGLSSGFLEPLQATSLHISLCQIEKLIEDVFCIENSTKDTIVRNDFNNYCKKLTEDMLDFVQATYTGGREDSDFWKYMTFEAKRSEKLEKILHLAKTRLIRFQDFPSYRGYAGQALWNYMLAGLGYFDKETIRQVFQSANIDLESLNFDYGVFKDQMNESLHNKMTCEDLNNLLLKGDELKLPLNKIY